MSNPYQIAASILSADFANLGNEVHSVLDAGADIIHFDVMDNHYVPNLTIGPMVCKALRDAGVTAPIDVHLMVKPVDVMISAFAEAGADIISIHPETTEHLHRSLQLIRDCGCKASLAFNPATPLSYLDHLDDELAMVLIMSVNPGFGGQTFIHNSLEKIRRVRKQLGPDIRIEVDGGIKPDNVAQIAAAGADTFVAGSAIFHGEDYPATINAFRNNLQGD